jgi:hypothetical protein
MGFLYLSKSFISAEINEVGPEFIGTNPKI